MHTNRKATDDYEKQWPKYCRKCNAWGALYEQFDPAPNAPGHGYILIADPCPECIEKGRCPRCADQMKPEEERCKRCGWTYEAGGRHEEH